MAQSLVFCVVFCINQYLSFCPSFIYYIVYPSIYNFWLSISYPQTFFKKNSLINVREYRRCDQKLTLRRNWQHKVYKTKKNKTKNIYYPLQWWWTISPDGIIRSVGSASALTWFIRYIYSCIIKVDHYWRYAIQYCAILLWSAILVDSAVIIAHSG